MKYIEYGNDNQDTVILLHGGGLSWWNYEDVGNALQMIIASSCLYWTVTPKATKLLQQ